MHVPSPALLGYVPAVQLVHDDAPGADVDRVGHAEHDVTAEVFAPAGMNVPAGHAEHPLLSDDDK